MNKNLKFALIFLNVIMILIAGYWLNKNREPEPLFVLVGQVGVVISLLFEKKVSKIFTKSVDNSKIKIIRKQTDEVHTEDIKDSTIDIQ
ncbi:hypothetical protein [Tenacibaculum ovolyticum]|uniref:hypothetical protein n=1 Tax=Tenacibaculum ovolyticum TaxID=104270 RepID=UPI001F386FA4|nr:hypothetical protein [Tenacibaculum ovolyticum]